MKAWTDYPIAQLGDEPFKTAPIREIEVLSYDRDKYCWIRLAESGVLENIKAGYIYEMPGRCGEVRAVPTSRYAHLPTGIGGGE